MTVTDALADFELSAMLMAVTLNVPAVLPAVYRPAVEIVPPVADQVTFSLVEPVTEAENCLPLPSSTDAVFGSMEIATTVGGVGFDFGEPFEPVHALSATVAKKMQRRFNVAVRRGADVFKVNERFGTVIVLRRMVSRLAAGGAGRYWPEVRIWHSWRKVQTIQAKGWRRFPGAEHGKITSRSKVRRLQRAWRVRRT